MNWQPGRWVQTEPTKYLAHVEVEPGLDIVIAARTAEQLERAKDAVTVGFERAAVPAPKKVGR